MKKNSILVLTLIAVFGIILSGCSNTLEDINPEENNSVNADADENTTQEDPINDTFEEDVVDENDTVEIGEII